MAPARRRKGVGRSFRVLLLVAAGGALGAAAVALWLRPELWRGLVARLRPRAGPAAPRSPQPPAPRPPSPRPAPAVARPTSVPIDFEPSGSGGRGVIALVVDDLGYGDEPLGRLAALPGPLSLAVLPDAPRSGAAAELAGRKGWDLLVHLPMAGGASREEARTVGPALSDAEIAATVSRAIDLVPGAIGLNNHQGSAATTDARVVRAVLGVVRDRGLFFLDSRTTAASVAIAEARRLGVSALERDVFLDDVAEEVRVRGGAPETIAAAWERALALAAKRGAAVVIGHPRPETLDFLERELPALAGRGFRLVKASELVD